MGINPALPIVRRPDHSTNRTKATRCLAAVLVRDAENDGEGGVPVPAYRDRRPFGSRDSHRKSSARLFGKQGPFGAVGWRWRQICCRCGSRARDQDRNDQAGSNRVFSHVFKPRTEALMAHDISNRSCRQSLRSATRSCRSSAMRLSG